MVKPGSKDRKASILITGMELDELQRFVWMIPNTTLPKILLNIWQSQYCVIGCKQKKMLC
jgi:hypothetical protein